MNKLRTMGLFILIISIWIEIYGENRSLIIDFISAALLIIGGVLLMGASD